MRGTQTLFSVPKHLITALLSYRDTGVLSGVGPCIYRRFVGWAMEIHGCREARGGGAQRDRRPARGAGGPHSYGRRDART